MTAAELSPLDTAGTSEVTVDDVAELVRRWLDEAAAHPVKGAEARAAAQLAGLLRDPDGLAFATGFVDGVVRPEDPAVGAAVLRRLAQRPPAFLSPALRSAVKAGGTLGPVAPGVVVPAAKRALREMVGHLVVDATDAKLGKSLQRIRGGGDATHGAGHVRLNLNLLGEAVLGAREADRRLAGLRRLVERPDVDYVSVKTSAVVGPHAPWGFEEDVEHVVERLAPLYETAAAQKTFLNLDMEEYKDLDLTLEVFTRLLDRPSLRSYEAGIVLQAYLPDALAAMQRLQTWAARRVAAGGSPIKVRLVKGANLSMERVDADVHGWPLATWNTKAASDAHYKRVLDWALTPERTANVRLGVAGHNLFDIAHAWLLAGARGAREGMEVEMLLGMAAGQAAAVRRETGSLLLYTPVVHPREFDVAIAYLVRRLEEVASPDNFMSAITEITPGSPLFARELARHTESLELLAQWRQQALAEHGDADAPPSAHRRHDRPADRYLALPHAPGEEGFVNTPDSDPAVEGHRSWVRAALSRAATSRAGTTGRFSAAGSLVDDAELLDDLLARTAAAGEAWGRRPARERAAVLHAAGRALEARRAELLEVMASEAGKTADQADPEISEAVDFAHYYAECALELAAIEARDGVRAVPARLTLVTPPWNFPVAIPAGGVLAALAAGSAVVLKPAEPAQRCGAVLAEAIAAALAEVGGAEAAAALRVVTVDEGGLGRQLVSSPRVDRVILTGAYATAELFRTFRADLPLLAETSGKNAMIVTPSADLDLAARDVVASAFGHAGQKCSASSLVVLVGSVATSRRFRDQLLDAAASLVVGAPWDPRTQVGPVIEKPEPGSALHWGLTELEPGQHWALTPEAVKTDVPSLAGRLWTPGIRSGVRRGSKYHRTEVFGPVLGVMTARTLDEAIDIVNDVDYGLTSGIHSLDASELRRWASRIQAGNLYVNRGTTGAIVQRQPFGGWKKSAVGAGTKAGGPSYLLGLTQWERADALEGAAFLERAAASDETAWESLLGAPQDPSGLVSERNWLRHVPTPVTVRAVSGASPVDVERVLAAAARTGAPVEVSLAAPLPCAPTAVIEDDDAWLARAAADSQGPSSSLTRVRLVGPAGAADGAAAAATALAEATGGRPDLAVWHGQVTASGRLELLPFLHEQAVSATAHRFGTPSALVDDLLAP
ncbi:L-proline dehydrogenase [Quadrisphaera granulorum]|uniref:L-glutamate gamma-semialdehyde dehydrogenase n=1 Tax=Quadrisphaera granulorum TaxID=317664 RepID=A0A315ZVE1_9ACTN|nr:bifunctional proline dehydrogenase/L-glutamate gamma-semialdehyde dehydrogenase [Quadrisphaera granulorum]PWJ49576.1 L-proline dehydrogenase [Quadrisphaera granulorum]SZE98155.1 L-proline dehydrogenase [Quadrisphaera granulorum]